MGGHAADRIGNGLISFSTADEGNGVHIRDELGGGNAVINTDCAVTPQRSSPDWFLLPVDAAVSFETSTLEFRRLSTVSVRDFEGKFLGTLTTETWNVEGPVHYIDASGSLKLYAYVEDASFEAALHEKPDNNYHAVIEFDEPTRVVLGARSNHEQPMATMTVPDDPEAMMEAFSYLGSSMKEWSVERSWPTLRGHPPAIERGERLHIPDALEKPDTGVTIAVPPTYANVYRVAPLAFYLGADIVPGDEPELRLDLGYTEPLGRGRELEATVDELLAQCLVLDSLVRSDGYFSVPRYEYDEIAPLLHFYPPELYERSIEKQLLEYLEIPFSALEPFVPQWPVTGVFRANPADADLVPSLLTSLGRIHIADRPPENAQNWDARASPSVVTGYTSSNPPAGDALFTSAGLDNGRDATVSAPSELSMLFVATDESRISAIENTTWGIFGVSGSGPSVEVTGQPTCTQLRQHLARNVDFLHYGGRVTDEGFVCADGVVPFGDVPAVGATAFSFTAGDDVTAATSLLEAGAAVGVVAERESPDADLALLARYLTVGYPFALSARLAGFTNARFAGDATVSLARRKNGNVPLLLDIVSSDTDVDCFQASVRGVLTGAFGLGTASWLDTEYHHDTYQLSGVDVPLPTSLSASEVVDLMDDDCVIRVDGELVPREDLHEATIRQFARENLQPKPEPSQPSEDDG